MFIKMTTKSKFSPQSSKNGAIGLNTLYNFSSSALNPLTLIYGQLMVVLFVPLMTSSIEMSLDILDRQMVERG